jgi:hypothetical protein
MGDRANIVLNFGKDYSPIYLYSHWGGNSLPGVLGAALSRGQNRWDDAPYLYRIIFSEMIKEEVNEETGFGISPYQTDNEYDLIHVNLETQQVQIAGTIWTFEEYLKMGPDSFSEFKDSEPC